MKNGVVSDPAGGEVGFQELFSEAWAARWLVCGIVLLLTIVGAIVGLELPKQYRAEVLVAPAESQSGAMGGLGAMASQFGALASLTGLSGSGKGPKDEALAVLQSSVITEAYIRDKGLLPVLFADRWDAQSRQWRTDGGRVPPSLWMGNAYFKKKVRDVKEDKASGLITMRITWRDPVEAASWANGLVHSTNQYLREKAIAESDRNITYLNEQAAKTDVLEARTAIFSILKSEVNKQMIARGREEFALKILDPAQPPEVPSTPPALLLAIGGFAAGLLVSGLFVWRRSFSG